VASSGPPPAPDTLGALRHPYVRAVAIGRGAARMGAQFIAVAVGWALYERTGDAWALGLVGLVEVAPVVLLMVPAGNAADRFPRRNVAMAAHALLALAALGLAWVAWRQAPVPLVYGLLVLVGAARALAAPAVESLVPQLVPPHQLANAEAWLTSTGQLASISGAALAGGLIALSGSETPPFLAAAGLSAVFVATLATLPAIAPQPSVEQRRVRDLFAGLAFIRRSPVFLAAITLDLFAVLFGGAVALLPIFAKDVLAVGPSGLGVLRAAPAVGALVAALMIARWSRWERPGRVLLLVVAGFGLATIGFGLSRDLLLSLACLFAVGALDSVSAVIRATLQQMITPDRLRGRVAAVEQVFVGFSNELGAFESGATAALFGPVVSVVGGGVGTLLVVLAVALGWPALARIGPLHTLEPLELETERPLAPP
jgi:MFS family permease